MDVENQSFEFLEDMIGSEDVSLEGAQSASLPSGENEDKQEGFPKKFLADINTSEEFLHTFAKEKGGHFLNEYMKIGKALAAEKKDDSKTSNYSWQDDPIPSTSAAGSKRQAPNPVPRNFKKKFVEYDVDDEEMFLPQEFQSGFFDTEDTVRIGPIFSKLAFDSTHAAYFAYLRKSNANVSPDMKDSIMKCGVFELEDILPRLKQFIHEVITCPRKEMVPFLQGDEPGAEKNRNTDDFYEGMYTICTASRSIIFRPFRSANGIYRVIIHKPKAINRNAKRGMNNNWRGPSFSLTIGLLVKLVQLWDEYIKEVNDKEMEYLTNTKDRSQWPNANSPPVAWNFTTRDGIPNEENPLLL